jgi:hypothetical protein
MGAISLDLAFEGLVLRKIQHATGLPPSAFSPAILSRKDQLLGMWEKKFKPYFQAGTLIDGGLTFEIPGNTLQFHR